MNRLPINMKSYSTNLYHAFWVHQKIIIVILWWQLIIESRQKHHVFGGLIFVIIFINYRSRNQWLNKISNNIQIFIVPSLTPYLFKISPTKIKLHFFICRRSSHTFCINEYNKPEKVMINEYQLFHNMVSYESKLC